MAGSDFEYMKGSVHMEFVHGVPMEAPAANRKRPWLS